MREFRNLFDKTPHNNANPSDSILLRLKSRCVPGMADSYEVKVLHPQRGVLYKSGVYALKVTCLTLGDLRGLFTSKADTASPVGDEQLVDKVVERCNLLTALRKSRVTKAVY